MYNIIIAAFILKIAPTVVGAFFVLEDAYGVSYMSDMLVTLLLSWFAYLAVPKEKRYIKNVCVVALIVNALFLFNYVFVKSASQSAGFELIGN